MGIINLYHPPPKGVLSPERTYEDGLRDGMKAAVRHGGDPGNAAVDRLLKRYLRGVSYQED